MQYSFRCPLPGCSTIMNIDAQNDDEAVNKLTEQAKIHLASAHPDIHKTDEQIQEDIRSHMTFEDKKPEVGV